MSHCTVSPCHEAAGFLWEEVGLNRTSGKKVLYGCAVSGSVVTECLLNFRCFHRAFRHSEVQKDLSSSCPCKWEFFCQNRHISSPATDPSGPVPCRGLVITEVAIQGKELEERAGSSSFTLDTEMLMWNFNSKFSSCSSGTHSTIKSPGHTLAITQG